MSADPRTLADRLDHRATQNAIVRSYGIAPSSRTEDDDLDRAAANRLRHLDALLDAIGDPYLVSLVALRCDEEAEACQQIGGFGETVNVLDMTHTLLRRIADAVDGPT